MPSVGTLYKKVAAVRYLTAECVRRQIQPMLQQRWLRWTLIFGGWTAIALFFASQTYLSYRVR